jgi:hypothetical protein
VPDPNNRIRDNFQELRLKFPGVSEHGHEELLKMELLAAGPGNGAVFVGRTHCRSSFMTCSHDVVAPLPLRRPRLGRPKIIDFKRVTGGSDGPMIMRDFR